MKTTQIQFSETREVLQSVNKDIEQIRTRLEKGLDDDHLVLLNYRILRQAIQVRDEAIQVLENKWLNEITLPNLFPTP